MPVQITIKDALVQGRGVQELEKDVWEGLIIRDYLNARISIGELAELMGMELMDARDWLHKFGIATMRKFTDPALERTARENYERLRKELITAL